MSPTCTETSALGNSTAGHSRFSQVLLRGGAARPSACLLVGDGSYDFLNLLGTGTPDLIPPFIVSPNFDETAGDQLFVSFGPLGTLDRDTSRIAQTDRGWDMMVARWPVRDVSDLQIVMNKIQQYEAQPELGVWRNRVVLVADDEFGESGVGSEFFHTEQAEESTRRSRPPMTGERCTCSSIQKRRRQQAGRPRRHRAKLERGMLLIDYVGHGSPNVWRTRMCSVARAICRS